MIKSWLFILSLTLLAGLAACSTSPYPLDMNKEQWQKLSPEERKSLLLKQQEYDESQRLARIKANAKERELKLKLKLKEEARLSRLYSEPGSGNVVMLNLLSGEYRYKKTRYQIQPVSMLIARGETKEIDLTTRDHKQRTHRERLYVKYLHDGTGVYLYRSSPSRYSDDYIGILRDGRWNCGSTQRKSFQFSKYESLNNLKIFIKEQHSSCHARRFR